MTAQSLAFPQPMSQQITTLLSPVKRRLRWRNIHSRTAIGAAVSGALCLLLGFLRITIDWPETTAPQTAGLFAIVFCSGILLGAVWGIVERLGWKLAAAEVDQHYGWKDRTTTALQLSGNTSAPLARLQVADAVNHLQTVNSVEVVPLQMPRAILWAAGCAVVAIGTVLLPNANQPLKAAVTVRSASVKEAATEIRDRIDEIDQLAEESGLQPLKDLVVRLKRDLTKLDQPDAEVRESLKTMSAMQQKMQSMMSELNIEAMDASLADVADALDTASAFKPAANSLKQQALAKAADALQNVDAENIDRTESRPTAEKLSDAALSAKEKGLKKLSESLDELAESVKAGDAAKTAEASEKLATKIKTHDLAKSMNQMLKRKSDQLAAAKTKFAANSNSEGNGAAADATGLNLVKGKSDSQSGAASRKAGAKAAGNIDGEKTRLDGQKQMARLTGQLTEAGDSDKETIAGEASEQQAQRLAQEAFTKYQKMSEAVLEHESIPPGHRQTIRKYFELIRPEPGADESAR
ncbi:hypothetical protein [Fuerstiella marisgermanici]|uniref:Uncharacterized protein n=1 Tax=Fuerstiella marisgermanici TaxID=1891926 RepID=A0A1P8WHV5_9PLAN|nr:hypothetical protein [Fuerstiella marisgermanici]APZ93613.1 hypothetical protein Fuma_03231 [Fuerstiella marisgermanici]